MLRTGVSKWRRAPGYVSSAPSYSFIAEPQFLRRHFVLGDMFYWLLWFFAFWGVHDTANSNFDVRVHSALDDVQIDRHAEPKVIILTLNATKLTHSANDILFALAFQAMTFVPLGRPRIPFLCEEVIRVSSFVTLTDRHFLHQL